MSSESTSTSPIPAKAEVNVSPDKLLATIRLTPPMNEGPAMTYDQLSTALASKSVVHGIYSEKLRALAEKPVYDDVIVIAQGKPSVEGVDACLEYHIRLHKDLKPKVKEDGSVDFRDLGLIEQVEEGGILCVKTARTLGEPGMSVFGLALVPKPGKDLPMPSGKNTRLSDDKLTLYAAITGQADYINNKINILNTHTVNGDISASTGNVNFMGNIIVKGNVMKGFSVTASGNIDISGMVESAAVMAGGSLIVRGGVNGVDGGHIEAAGNVACKFIQGGKVKVGGDLTTTYIMNADVQCGGSVNMTGKGLIIGGHIMARNNVTAVNIGSASNSGNTVIEVGNDPELVKRSYALPKELETCAQNIHKIEMIVKALAPLRSAGALNAEKTEQLEKSERYLEQLKTMQAELNEEYEIVKEQVSQVGSGTIKVMKTAYPGVKLIIGSLQFAVQTEHTFTTFIRTKDGISAGPMR